MSSRLPRCYFHFVLWIIGGNGIDKGDEHSLRQVDYTYLTIESANVITEQTIQAIFDAIRIEEVVGDFVQLKRTGSNLKGLCPFHGEKTPSFVVSPGRNTFKCFGCDKGGSAVTFIMEHEHLTYPEALRYLAAKYGIEVEETGNDAQNRQERLLKDSLFLANDYAQSFFSNQLLNTDHGKSIGLRYFRDRGFSDETIRKFGLGYAPAGGKDFLQNALNEGYAKEYLEQLGLVSGKGFDFFRDRVMFPIHHPNGKVVAFAGRILSSKAKAPKYINSPETEIYVKSKVLYGLFQARNAIRKSDLAIVVEGYTDVISMHQAGIEHVVATSGTALGESQIGLLKRLTPNVLLLFDGDKAGRGAALRGVDLFLSQDMNVRVVSLPEGEDPDSFVTARGQADALAFFDAHAQDFIFFKAGLLAEDAKDDPVKKAAMVNDILGSVARIPDPIKRALYIKECSSLLDIDENSLVDVTNKLVAGYIRDTRKSAISEQPKEPSSNPLPGKPPAHPPQKTPVSAMETREREIARLLITFGDRLFDEEQQITVAEQVLGLLQEVIHEFDHSLYGQVVKDSFQLLQDGKPVTSGYFIDHHQPGVRQLAMEMVQSPYEYSDNWERMWDIILQSQKKPDENIEKDCEDVLLRFKYEKVTRMIEKNAEAIRQIDHDTNASQLEDQLLIQMELSKIKDQIARQLRLVVSR